MKIFKRVYTIIQMPFCPACGSKLEPITKLDESLVSWARIMECENGHGWVAEESKASGHGSWASLTSVSSMDGLEDQPLVERLLNPERRS